MGLKEARLEAGMSQGALAKASGVHQALISQIETGQTKNPRVDYAIALCGALGRTVEEVFGKQDKTERTVPSC